MTKEQVLEKLTFDVELRGLSKHTQAEYYTKVKIFQDHFNKSATELDEKDIRKFLHYLSTEKGLTSGRSEERRVGKECRIGCRSRWSPYH